MNHISVVNLKYLQVSTEIYPISGLSLKGGISMKFVLSILCGFFFFGGLLSASSVSAKKQEKVLWGCDAYSASTCYFSIHYSSGGNRNFTMRKGEREKISGVIPDKDQYCLCVDTPTPSDLNQCNNGYQGKFCKRDTINRSYNN
jgi:hypothetical protein